MKRGVISSVRTIRQICRLLGVAGVFLVVGIDYVLRGGWRFSAWERAEWLKRAATLMLRTLGYRVTVHGKIPEGGFVAPNHMGYMDIVVLASVAPQVFLSKKEVGDWPVVGLYTRMAGTLYIDRARRSDVANKEEAFSKVIAAGLSMTFFLEGTSTDGRAVLPFRASLLQPVVANSWPITPAYLKYECVGGDVAQDVCWWGTMTFGSHLLRMTKVERVNATVIFGEKREPGTDRKRLASELYEDVLKLEASLASGDC